MGWLYSETFLEIFGGGKNESQYPVLQAYLGSDGNIDNNTVRKLREEFVRISETVGDLELGLIEDGTFVPVERIGGRFYSANSDAGFFLTGVGIPKDFPAKDKIKELVRYSIQLCDEAIRRECGFGEYSKPSS